MTNRSLSRIEIVVHLADASIDGPRKYRVLLVPSLNDKGKPRRDYLAVGPTLENSSANYNSDDAARLVREFAFVKMILGLILRDEIRFDKLDTYEVT